jgi:5-formyltetrahydrofolate cyclo-ligase
MKALRAAMRRRRAALPPALLASHSAAISGHLWRLPLFSRCRRIACYMAVGGEVDCGPFMQEALARGRALYLPVVHGEALVFAPWRPGAPLARNHFGIPEPAGRPDEWLRGSQLDVALTPLVAFDASGRRLGMGGGFYDRTFAFTRHRGGWRHPHLVGIAHDFQRVDALPGRSWDIDLHAVATECGVQIY